jgi:hypothetical protein
MNMAYNLTADQDQEFDGQFQPIGKDKRSSSTRRSTFRNRKAPVSVNGMHRRRNKKFVW